jgi:VanZ family protein
MNKLTRWLAPFAWMGLIFYLSAQSKLPHLTPPGLPDIQDVVGHLAIYAVLALLWERALRGAGVPKSALWAFVIAILYGVTDEYHQSFVPGRTATVFDLATDAVAAGVALGLATWARRRTMRGLQREANGVPAGGPRQVAPERVRGESSQDTRRSS